MQKRLQKTDPGVPKGPVCSLKSYRKRGGPGGEGMELVVVSQPLPPKERLRQQAVSSLGRRSRQLQLLRPGSERDWEATEVADVKMPWSLAEIHFQVGRGQAPQRAS